MKDFFFKYWKTIAGMTVTAAVVIFFILPPIAHTVIEKKIFAALERLQTRIGRKIALHDLQFLNTTSLTIGRLVMEPDSLIHEELTRAGVEAPASGITIRRIRIELAPGGFLTGQFLKSVTIDSIQAELIRTSDSTTNFAFVFKPQALPSPEDTKTSSGGVKNRIAQWVDDYLEKKLPSFEIRHLNIAYRDYSAPRSSGRKISRKPVVMELRDFALQLRESLLRDAQFELRGTIAQEPLASRLEMNGTLNHSKRQIVVNALFDVPFKIPFIKKIFDGEIYLKGLDAQIYRIEDEKDRSRIKAALNLSDVEIMSEAVSEKKLRNVNIGFDLDLDFGPDDMVIQPATRIYLNKITGFLSGSVDRLHGLPHWDLHFKLPMMAMNDFISSVPEGLMTRLHGMEVRGSFEFEAALDLDYAQLDSIKYQPTLKVSDDFKVLSLGDSIEVKALRDSFVYTFTREDKTDSAFWVAVSNPYFQPLDSLPPILIYSVLFCEDNSFFKNDGFNVLQIGRSLRDNIREKKFARGASTISMQFVKNIYLGREKTIARKFQELILTWLFNHEKFLDEKKDKEKHKKRLLEIYMNIIEWGPDIHGIGRASEFYFRKKPKDLTVGESVFLATIIPNPKKYERYFEDGLPKKKHADFMNLIVKMLHEKDIIDSLTMVRNLPCTFRITGEARRYMAGIQAADSTDAEQEWYYKDIELNP